MSHNFTPGPWRAEPFTDDPTKAFIMAGEGESERAIAIVEGLTGDIRKDKANLGVGQAAPDLLEALKAFVGKVEKQNTFDDWLAVIDKARAAIARAEGR